MKYQQEMYFIDTYMQESKKTGNPYRMFIFVTEDRRPLEVISQDVTTEYRGEMFDKVLCTFELTTGQYMNLKLLDIKFLDVDLN